jgi:hypothetical protein
LCWAGTLRIDEESRVDVVLAALHDLYERAMQPWEQLRTVQPDNNRLSVCRIDDLLQDEKVTVYDRWPYGTFPAAIQREARFRFRELKTTSRDFSIEDVPDKWALERLHPFCKPLEFRHIAGLAATACIVEALEQYQDTIEEWAGAVCGQFPGLPFTWLVQREPGRLGHTLAAHLASGKSRARERELQAAMLVRNAESWLALADSDDYHQAEIEQVTVRSNAQVAVKVRAEISSRNTAASKARKQIKPTIQEVADYFNKHQREKHEALVNELADQNKVSTRTIERRHQKAKKEKLLT